MKHGDKFTFNLTILNLIWTEREREQGLDKDTYFPFMCDTSRHMRSLMLSACICVSPPF
jgi:hypothetical protein